MTKKKGRKPQKYIPQKDDDWDFEADKEHRRIISEKENTIRDKYKKHWNFKTNNWQNGFKGH